MPSVGTLNLQVQSNAGTVGDSLGQLAGALERIRKAVPENGLGLSKIGTDISTFVKQIKEIESISTVSKTLESIGNGMVGMAKFLKFSTDSVKESTDGIKESVSSINTKPAVDAINDLKGAIGSGLNLGTAGVQLKNIQSVLSKDWNLEGAKAASSVLKTIGEGAKSLSSKGLGTHAKDISALAAALQEFATATEAVKTAVGEGQNGIDSPNMKYESLGKDGAAGYAQGIESGKEQVAEASANMINAGLESGAEAQDSHSPSRKYMKLGEYGAEGYIEGFKDKYAEAAQTVSDFIRGLLSHATEGTAQQFGQIASVAIRQAFSKAFDNIGIPEAKLKIMQGAADLAASVTNGMVSSAKGNYERVATEAAAFIRESIIAASNNVFKDATDKTGLSETENAIRQTNETLQDYQGSVQEATSAVSSLNSEEEKLSINAKKASRDIQHLLDRLNEVKKDKGFGDRFNWSLGIDRPPINATESAAVFEADAVREYNIELRETGDIITSVLIPRFMEMYQVMSMMAYEFGSFMREGARLMSGESFLALTDGRTPGQMLLGDGSEPETFLSTWVRTGEEFKTDWVYFTSDIADQWRAAWSPDFILGGWSNVPQRMSHMLLGDGGRTGQLLLGDGGVAPENMLSTRVDYSEQWRQDWTDGSDWKPDWIVGDGKVSEAVDEIHEATTATQEFADSIDHLKKAAGDSGAYDPAIEFARKWNAAKPKDYQFAEEQNSIPFINDLIENASQIDLMNMKIESMTDRLYEGAASGKLTGEQIANLVMQIQKAREEVDNLIASTTGMTGAWNAFKTGIQKMFPTITSLLKRFRQIAKYRLLRSVLKHITSGFSEGVKNVYNYSKAVGTALAPAMDQAATALQQMKNSIGAAAAPAIMALVPVLQNVVDWFVTLINYANQFFALLNGQNTWTRALPEQAEAFEKSTKAAKGTSKAMKDLLADWDELNIIQSQGNNNSGTGSGKTAEEYKNMFEEVDKFDEGVKDTLRFIDEYLGGLPGILAKAGLALLGWKFSKAFTGFLGTLGKLVAGGVLISVGLELVSGSAFEAGQKGYFDQKDIIRTIVGSIATALGGSLITTALGLGGTLGFGIGLLVAAVITITWFCVGEKDALDRRKWGNRTMSQEEIEKYVQDQFSFDVDAEIEVMKAHISDTDQAKQAVNDAVKQFSYSLKDAEKVVADVDTSTAQQKIEAVKKAADDAQAAIIAVQSLIDANEEGLTYTLTNFKFTDAEGNDITTELLNSIQISNETLREYFTDVGAQLAKLMLEGEKSGWKNGEMEAALELMASQKRIYDKAEELQAKMKFELEASTAIKDVVDRDTAEKVLEEQKKKFNEYKATVEEMVRKEADNLVYLASLAESAAIEAGLDTEEGQKIHAA